MLSDEEKEFLGYLREAGVRLDLGWVLVAPDKEDTVTTVSNLQEGEVEPFLEEVLEATTIQRSIINPESLVRH